MNVLQPCLLNGLTCLMQFQKSKDRTQYALALLLEKNNAKAETIMNEFEKAAKSYPYPQEIDSERDLLRIVWNYNKMNK